MNELMITSRITKIKYKPTLLQRIFGIPESEELPVLFERSCHGFYEIPSTSIEYEIKAQEKAQKDAEDRARNEAIEAEKKDLLKHDHEVYCGEKSASTIATDDVSIVECTKCLELLKKEEI